MELLAPEGLLMGWCMAHGISQLITEREDSAENLRYRADLEKLLDWLKYREVGEINFASYIDFKARIMAAIKHELEHTSDMSRVVSLDCLEVIKLNGKWLECLEVFSLVTPEEATEIETLSGVGSERKRNLHLKPYLPSGRQAAWVQTVEDRLEKVALCLRDSDELPTGYVVVPFKGFSQTVITLLKTASLTGATILDDLRKLLGGKAVILREQPLTLQPFKEQ